MHTSTALGMANDCERRCSGAASDGKEHETNDGILDASPFQLRSNKEGIYTRQAIDVVNPHHLKHRTPMQQIINVHCLPLSHAFAVSICSLPFPASTRPKITSAGDTPHREITFHSHNHHQYHAWYRSVPRLHTSLVAHESSLHTSLKAVTSYQTHQ